MDRRHQTGLAGLFLMVAGVLLVMGWGIQKPPGGSASLMSQVGDAPSSPIVAAEEDDDIYFETVITMTDMLNLPEIASYIDWIGLSADSSEQQLLQYLPKKIIVKGYPSRMGGVIGENAAEGVVAFSLALQNNTETFSSAFNVIINVNGTIEHMSPTFQKLGWGKHSAGMKFHPENPKRMILAMDSQGTEYGPWAAWNYEEEEEYSFLVKDGFLNDCHDIQVSHNSSSNYWGVRLRQSFLRPAA